MRRIVTVLAAVAVALFVVLTLFWAAQRKLIYFPTQRVGDVLAVSSDSEEVSFTTDDGLTLAAWWIPAGSHVSNGNTIVVFHGNAGNRADRATLALEFTAKGYNVMLVDYRGYGRNPGKPSETGLLLDGRAAITYVRSRPEVDAQQLVYFGESLGAAVAIAVAQEIPPTALVLRSPFTSLSDVVSHHYPFIPTSLVWDRYLSIDTIGTLDVPVLVIAGSGDTVVPFAQSRELYEAATGPRRFVTIEDADHNDPALTHGPTLIDEITTFLDMGFRR